MMDRERYVHIPFTSPVQVLTMDRESRLSLPLRTRLCCLPQIVNHAVLLPLRVLTADRE
jgi:hypothetical protein